MLKNRSNWKVEEKEKKILEASVSVNADESWCQNIYLEHKVYYWFDNPFDENVNNAIFKIDKMKWICVSKVGLCAKCDHSVE